MNICTQLLESSVKEADCEFALELLIPKNEWRPIKVVTSRGTVKAFWFKVGEFSESFTMAFNYFNLLKTEK